MCGKTTVIKILQESLTLVSEFKTWTGLKEIPFTKETFEEEIKVRE